MAGRPFKGRREEVFIGVHHFSKSDCFLIGQTVVL